MTTFPRVLLALALGALLNGCNCGGPPPSPDEDGGVVEETPDASTTEACVRDPDLLATHPACVRDDQCPCGAFCDLGQCTAQCAADSECADGERCDSYGRCRPAATSAPAPRPPLGIGGALSAPASLLLAADGSGVLSLVVIDRDVPRARIVGRGATLTCPGGDPGAAECVLTDLKVDDIIEVGVQRDSDGGGDEDAVSTVLAVTEGHRLTVSLTMPVEDPIAVTPIAGAYEGSGTLIATGLGDSASTAGTGPSGVPFQARVWGDEAGTVTVAIDDDLGALTNAGALIGTVTLTQDGTTPIFKGSIAFPNTGYAQGALRTETWEAIAQLTQAELIVDTESGTLSLSLTEEFEGLGFTTRPWVSWELSFSRTGELSDPAPAIPAPAALSYDEDAKQAAMTPWESLVAARYPSYATLPEQTRRAMWGHLFASEPHPLDVCFVPDAERAASQADARRYFLGATEGLSGSPATLAAREEYLPRGLSYAGVPGGTVDSIAIQSIDSVTTASTDPRMVPCRMGLYAFDVALPSGNHLQRTPLNVEDQCNQLRERTGCEIVHLGAGALNIDGTLAVTYHLGNGSPVTETVQLQMAGSANYYCRLPEVPLHCAQALACVEPSISQAPNAASAIGFSSTLLPTSGDAQCATGGRTAAIELDAAADDPDPTLRPTKTDAFDGCLAELDALRNAPLPSTTKVSAGGLRDLFQAGKCLDDVRTVAALMTALENDRRGGMPLSPAGEAATTYGHRLLARWLELHGYFASEVVQREQAADLFRESGGPGAPVTLEDAFDASVAGWDLLFLPRTGRALGNAPDVTVLNPDYRLRIPGVVGHDKDAQRAGLLVAIAETLAEQSKLLDHVLEQRQRELEQGTPVEVQTLVPRFVLARAIATGLAQRVMAQEPGWRARFESADQRAVNGLAGALARERLLAAGENPLGIADADLPLYFLADGATGPGGRFAAVSDFLLGTGPDSTAWAPTLLRQARAAEADARDAYLAQKDQQFRFAMTDQQMQIFIDEVAYDYDVQLRDLCGWTTGSYVADPRFNAAGCFISPDAKCGTDVPAWYATWKQADFEGQFCIDQSYRTAHYEAWGKHSFLSGQARGFSDKCYKSPNPIFSVVPCPGSGSGDAVCLTCSTDPTQFLPLDLSTFKIPHPTNPSETLGLGVTAARCMARHPGFRPVVPFPKKDTVASCVQGTLGEAALNVVAAGRDLQLAREEMNENLDAYEIAMKSCHILADRNAQIAVAEASFTKRMKEMRSQQAAADTTAAGLQAASDCAATGAGSSKDTPWGAAAGIVGTVVSCATGAAAATAEGVSNALQANMDNATVDHDAELQRLGNNAEFEVCYNDARQYLVGQAAAITRWSQAAFDLSRARATQLQLVQQAQILHDEGADYVASLEASRIPPPSGDPWLEDRVTLYANRMRLARRATYLAVRAVEYEFQQSLGERAQVFAANTPDDLEAVLTSLWATAGTRGIGGSKPSNLHAVLSLRDDVLRLGDNADLPDGFQNLTPAERLRALLHSSAYASYDENGRYEGQRIPFSLAPLGALGLPTGGVPIYGTTDCAERIWSVNAAIEGTNPWEGSDTTFVRIDLLKQNAFYSQWCSAPGEDDPPFQRASVRPAHNLFREPGVGGVVGQDLGIAQGERTESRARIQAYFNVTRAELEDAKYANGETSELAARGLFGDYALFIPAEMIAQETSEGSYTDGLVLDRIDDILLRVDYVSVAK